MNQFLDSLQKMAQQIGKNVSVDDALVMTADLAEFGNGPTKIHQETEKSKAARQKLLEILQANKRAIAKSEFDVGCFPNSEFKIDLIDPKKIHSAKQYKLQPWQIPILEKTIEKWKMGGIIQQAEGPYNSNCVIVSEATESRMEDLYKL